MTSSLHRLLLLIIVVISPQLTWAQQVKEVTIVEPGVIKLANLFKMADAVALVKVVSGDTENYDTAVYKAEVVKSFKGAEVGEAVYFGPYVGVRLGWEYVLFLRGVAKPLVPKTTSNVNYGTVHYSEVFNEGYSSMETSYECVFDGKQIAEHCDYAVRVCTDYITLPKSLATFPPMTEGTPFGCRWATNVQKLWNMKINIMKSRGTMHNPMKTAMTLWGDNNARKNGMATQTISATR